MDHRIHHKETQPRPSLTPHLTPHESSTRSLSGRLSDRNGGALSLGFKTMDEAASEISLQPPFTLCKGVCVVKSGVQGPSKQQQQQQQHQQQRGHHNDREGLDPPYANELDSTHADPHSHLPLGDAAPSASDAQDPSTQREPQSSTDGGHPSDAGASDLDITGVDRCSHHVGQRKRFVSLCHAALDTRQPYAFIGLAGVYDIARQLDSDASLGRSAMSPIPCGLPSLPSLASCSPALLFSALADVAAADVAVTCADVADGSNEVAGARTGGGAGAPDQQQAGAVVQRYRAGGMRERHWKGTSLYDIFPGWYQVSDGVHVQGLATRSSSSSSDKEAAGRLAEEWDSSSSECQEGEEERKEGGFTCASEGNDCGCAADFAADRAGITSTGSDNSNCTAGRETSTNAGNGTEGQGSHTKSGMAGKEPRAFHQIWERGAEEAERVGRRREWVGNPSDYSAGHSAGEREAHRGSGDCDVGGRYCTNASISCTCWSNGDSSSVDGGSRCTCNSSNANSSNGDCSVGDQNCSSSTDTSTSTTRSSSNSSSSCCNSNRSSSSSIGRHRSIRDGCSSRSGGCRSRWCKYCVAPCTAQDDYNNDGRYTGKVDSSSSREDESFMTIRSHDYDNADDGDEGDSGCDDGYSSRLLTSQTCFNDSLSVLAEHLPSFYFPSQQSVSRGQISAVDLPSLLPQRMILHCSDSDLLMRNRSSASLAAAVARLGVLTDLVTHEKVQHEAFPLCNPRRSDASPPSHLHSVFEAMRQV